jgi:ferrous iron transport protein A
MNHDPRLLVQLSDLKKGEHATLYDIQGGRGVISRLSTLGFTPGVEIEVAQNYGHGPLLVCVRGARVALGRMEAMRTLVLRSEP